MLANILEALIVELLPILIASSLIRIPEVFRVELISSLPRRIVLFLSNVKPDLSTNGPENSLEVLASVWSIFLNNKLDVTVTSPAVICVKSTFDFTYKKLVVKDSAETEAAKVAFAVKLQICLNVALLLNTESDPIYSFESKPNGAVINGVTIDSETLTVPALTTVVSKLFKVAVPLTFKSLFNSNEFAKNASPFTDNLLPCGTIILP